MISKKAVQRTAKKIYVLAVTLCCAALLVGHFFGSAVHASAFDAGRVGSVTIRLNDSDGLPVSGGSIAIFLVGDIAPSEDGFVFEWCEEFADCGWQTDEDLLEEIAVEALRFAEENGASCVEKGVSEKGEVIFDDLRAGLYLVSQKTAADGYSPINPFFISVPIMENGVYVYDIDASPKTGVVTQPTQPTTSSDETTTNRNSSDTETQTKPGLPVTGQLNWPVPMLGFCGLLFLVIGLMLCTGKRSADNEK